MQDLLQDHLLSVIIFLPLLGAIILMIAFPRPADEADSHGHGENDAPAKSSAAANAVRWFTLIISAATFGISLLLLTRYNQGTAGFQMVDGPAKWIEQYKINYHVGFD